MRLTLILIFFFLSIPSCLVVENPYPALAPGIWRGTLQLSPRMIQAPEEGEEEVQLGFQEVAQGELPFLFEVKYREDSTFYLEIINGEERIRVEEVTYGWDKATAKDTLRVRFPVFNTYIEALVEGPFIEGVWVDENRGEDYRIPFEAQFGRDFRFTRLRKEPVMDISGRWEVTFSPGTEDAYPAIGEFVQEGNQLQGTFLTETGDYRFLEGTVQADKLYLSTFDGTHAFLFEGKILPDSTITGSFRSGTHYRTTWEARYRPEAELTHPDSLTFLNPGAGPFDFRLSNVAGDTISPRDPQYQGKVRLIQILATWCPNCRDETRFLVEMMEKYADRPVEVIGLAFEKRSPETAWEGIETYREKMNIPYEILYAGPADKQKAAEMFPMLNHVLAWPTLIVLDKKGEVRRIHTGFSGPATSEYEAFRQEFTRLLDELLQESE